MKRQKYPYTDRNICSIPTQRISSPPSLLLPPHPTAPPEHTLQITSTFDKSQPPASAVGVAIVPWHRPPHDRRSRGPEETAGAVGSNLGPAHPQLRPSSIYSHREQGLRSGESSRLHILVNPKPSHLACITVWIHFTVLLEFFSCPDPIYLLHGKCLTTFFTYILLISTTSHC
jgi:hypothetical protein